MPSSNDETGSGGAGAGGSPRNEKSKKKDLVVSILDYGAGNVRSVRNAIGALGYEIRDIASAEQIRDAAVVVFPGVGAFGSAVSVLEKGGYGDALASYLREDRPFLGICLGMQTLFESSEEIWDNDEEAAAQEEGEQTHESGKRIPGLGIIPGCVVKFDPKLAKVPHIGWNGRTLHQSSPVFKYAGGGDDEHLYFVHSYCAPVTPENAPWVLSSTTYGGRRFVSSVQRGNVVATQFHPEKSGPAGLRFLRGFLEAVEDGTLSQTSPLEVDLSAPAPASPTLVKRIVVALDVRTNDHGDLVVTKGDQYDVRENEREGVRDGERGGVRNLGKPVALATRYYAEGADEIAFLNITSYRRGVVDDMPMLRVLEESSRNIFVPLTVGGGIRSYADPSSGRAWSALEVASRYFRAGADKVSLGSDAVHAAEEYRASGGARTGRSSIEQISRRYGVQAVVVSIDPKRSYAPRESDIDPRHVAVELDGANAGPNGEKWCWYQCTTQGGRQDRDICAVTVARAVEALGAGEIMLNCIDMDGQGKGFDLPLLRAVTSAVTIPVIASSGAGTAEHFSEVFTETSVEAALAAGMFHRKEVEIEAVKDHMRARGIPARTRS